MADDDPVIVAKYASVMQANFAQSLLESAGVASFLADEAALTCKGEIFPIGGARLYVSAADAEDARAILQDAISRDDSQ
jgi:hypothetical protein